MERFSIFWKGPACGIGIHASTIPGSLKMTSYSKSKLKDSIFSLEKEKNSKNKMEKMKTVILFINILYLSVYLFIFSGTLDVRYIYLKWSIPVP
jgi:hypothetical protein